jgi:hypothetical protein
MMRWFRPLGPAFLPVSAAGWAFTLLASAFCAQVFWAIDRHSHSVTDTLYGIFPFWAPTLLGLAWIADRTGGRPRD